MAKQEREVERWITVKGARVPIFKGQSVEEAIKESIGNRGKKKADEKKIAASHKEQEKSQYGSFKPGTQLTGIDNAKDQVDRLKKELKKHPDDMHTQEIKNALAKAQAAYNKFKKGEDGYSDKENFKTAKEWDAEEKVTSKGTMTPQELGAAEKRRDSLWNKEDHGKLTGAEKKELQGLEKSISDHYAAKKADGGENKLSGKSTEQLQEIKKNLEAGAKITGTSQGTAKQLAEINKELEGRKTNGHHAAKKAEVKKKEVGATISDEEWKSAKEDVMDMMDDNTAKQNLSGEDKKRWTAAEKYLDKYGVAVGDLADEGNGRGNWEKIQAAQRDIKELYEKGARNHYARQQAAKKADEGAKADREKASAKTDGGAGELTGFKFTKGGSSLEDMQSMSKLYSVADDMPVGGEIYRSDGAGTSGYKKIGKDTWQSTASGLYGEGGEAGKQYTTGEVTEKVAISMAHNGNKGFKIRGTEKKETETFKIISKNEDIKEKQLAANKQQASQVSKSQQFLAGVSSEAEIAQKLHGMTPTQRNALARSMNIGGRGKDREAALATALSNRYDMNQESGKGKGGSTPEFKSYNEAKEYYQKRFSGMSPQNMNRIARNMQIGGRGKEKIAALAEAKANEWVKTADLSKFPSRYEKTEEKHLSVKERADRNMKNAKAMHKRYNDSMKAYQQELDNAKTKEAKAATEAKIMQMQNRYFGKLGDKKPWSNEQIAEQKRIASGKAGTGISKESAGAMSNVYDGGKKETTEQAMTRLHKEARAKVDSMSTSQLRKYAEDNGLRGIKTSTLSQLDDKVGNHIYTQEMKKWRKGQQASGGGKKRRGQ